MASKLFEEPFFTGVNYWASHAGTNMWHIWDEDAIIEDFKRLHDNHIHVLRMFPLWSDFQPIKMLYNAAGRERQVRMGEDPIPDTEEGRAGVDPVMLERFARFCDLAAEYDLRLIVGLLTGWMSGRLYVPAAMEGRNVLTDPFCIKWELKYVRLMVSRFKDHPAIAGWDLGNECNCMGDIQSPDEAELWTAAISDAIRAADPEGTSTGLRPIVSGLHGLSPNGNWHADAHGELVDILTTHPYPIFTPYCDTDELGGFKSSLHATAQTVWYRGIGGKPAFAEEAGTLGPMICDEQVAAAYVNTVLYQLWAHDCRGFCWWCAAEQSHLTHAPYDWCAVERELGLFRIDGSPKPVTGVMKSFYEDIRTIGELPPRIVDAVCVTTRVQDAWAAAYGSFLCAKLAGLDLEFADGEHDLPEARAYILPSLCGNESMTRHAWYKLLDRVQEGATLLMSLDTALLSPFTEITGVRVHTRSRADSATTVVFPDVRGSITLNAPIRLKVGVTSAKILATETDGNPIMTVNRYGKGKICVITVPVEHCAAVTPHITEKESLLSYFYTLADLADPRRAASVADRFICMTEHVNDESVHTLVLVNPTAEARRVTVKLAPGWTLDRPLSPAADVRATASGISAGLAADGAVVFTIRK